jgi:hypothetical protein
MADRNDILLKEYEICQQRNDSIGSQTWTSTTIFMTANVTLLVGLVYGILTSETLARAIAQKDVATTIPQITAAIGGILVVGGGIIVILCRWISWLKRMRFLTGLNYQRMTAIEKALGMRRQWLVRYFDKRYDSEVAVKANKPDRISKRYKYSSARGFESTICIAKTLIILWSIFIGGGACTIITLAFQTGVCWGVGAVVVLAVGSGMFCLIRLCRNKKRSKA